MDELTNDCYNRRKHPRVRVFLKARYLSSGGTPLRSEIINTSSQGARITTENDIRVGDRFLLLSEPTTDLEAELKVEARWTRPLPGGLRQVVGVQKVE